MQFIVLIHVYYMILSTYFKIYFSFLNVRNGNLFEIINIQSFDFLIFVLAYAYFNACVFAHLFSILQIIFFFQFFVTWMYVWSIVAPWQFCGPPSTPLIPLTGESKWFRDFFMLDAERPKANAGYWKLSFALFSSAMIVTWSFGVLA